MVIIETFSRIRPKGHVPNIRSDYDRTYEMNGVPITIDGLGNVVKSGTPQVPPECTVVAYGCGFKDCSWFIETNDQKDARSPFSRHQELHDNTPSMVPLVRVPPEIFVKLLKKPAKTESDAHSTLRVE